MAEIVGRSNVTPLKHQDFELVLVSIIKSFLSIRKYKAGCSFSGKNSHWWKTRPFRVIDLTAGDADSLEGDSSPMIILRTMYKYKISPMSILLFEEGKKQFPKLVEQVRDYIFSSKEKEDYFLRGENTNENFEKEVQFGNVYLYNWDFVDWFKEEQGSEDIWEDFFKAWNYGVLFYDPNGFKIKDWDMIVKFSEVSEKNAIDFCLNMNNSLIERLRLSSHKGHQSYMKDCRDLLLMLNKKKKFIRRHFGKDPWHWKLVIATNFDRYLPPNGNREKQYKFYSMDSVMDQMLLDEDEFKKEIKNED